MKKQSQLPASCILSANIDPFIYTNATQKSPSLPHCVPHYWYVAVVEKKKEEEKITHTKALTVSCPTVSLTTDTVTGSRGEIKAKTTHKIHLSSLAPLCPWAGKIRCLLLLCVCHDRFCDTHDSSIAFGWFGLRPAAFEWRTDPPPPPTHPPRTMGRHWCPWQTFLFVQTMAWLWPSASIPNKPVNDNGL